MTNPIHKVNVALGTRSYNVLVGANLLNNIASHLEPLTYKGQRIALVADKAVDTLYGDVVADQLTNYSFHVHRSTIATGETSKSFGVLEVVCRNLLQSRLERGDLILSLGGGVTGDLVGFAAAIVRRGIRVAHLPTSLLAQVDSSVGGKTGINTEEGKNLIGAFHQPSLVLADTAVLDTLPERHKRAGYAEIIKYALLGDYAFFEWLEVNAPRLFEKETIRTEAIARSVAGKAAIVSHDETEQGERAFLNLGHTFGHALEALSGYNDSLFHGEAVSIGIMLALRFSQRIGWLDGQSVERTQNHLLKLGMPCSVTGLPEMCHDADAIVNAMMQDKKVTSGAINLILLKALGQAGIAKNVDPNTLRDFLNETLSYSTTI